MARNPVALEVRRLQALTEIGAEHNSVIIVAMPIDSAGPPATVAIARAVAQSSQPD